jgi:hypothetical protein
MAIFKKLSIKKRRRGLIFAELLRMRRRQLRTTI